MILQFAAFIRSKETKPQKNDNLSTFSLLVTNEIYYKE